MKSARPPVLILGAGINGCSVARELVLNGVDVCLVDLNDIAFGATARSSRLIHGGLRYLEFGDIRLVRESLRERSRLRTLAPQFVEPLRLFIPVSRRTGGLARAAFRFSKAVRSPLWSWMSAPFEQTTERGLWLVRMGLWMYQRLARDRQFAGSESRRLPDPSAPQVDPDRFRWVCSYVDGRMPYPERFVLALLEDARASAAEQDLDFRVLTYHRVELTGRTATIRRRGDDAAVQRFDPPLIVNATGAWGDLTLGQLKIPARRLFGGTKGSHVVTHHEGLRRALGGGGVYAEAPDGRLIFVLPFGESVLIGTTDERFEEDPGRAVASTEELRYLIDATNRLFPEIGLSDHDVDVHYSGIRPLPYLVGAPAEAVTRDHWTETHEDGHPPVLTLVGGKLTTCRSFAEQVGDEVLARLQRDRTATTRHRPVPGGRDYPETREALEQEWDRVAEEFGLTRHGVRRLWSLCGNRLPEILDAIGPLSGETLEGTDCPVEFARWVIENEWVGTLEDLVERRLLLLFDPRLDLECLQQLAQYLVDAGLLDESERDTAVQAAVQRLRKRYGKAVDGVTV